MSTIIGDNYSLVSLGTLTFMTPLFFTTLSTSKRKRQAFLPVLKIPMTYRKQKNKATLFGGSGRGVRGRGHDCFVFQVYPTIRRCLKSFHANCYEVVFVLDIFVILSVV